MMGQHEQRSNIHGADILRGVAILLVVTYHMGGQVMPWAGWTREFHVASVLEFLRFYPVGLGWVGVPLFFVLSGFCIEYSTLRAGSLKPLSFFWRRFWRIYPTYLVSLVILAAYARVDLSTQEGMEQVISHLLFLHNFQESTLFEINPSFWSIATEVQLYLLFPLFLAIRVRFGMKGALLVAFLVGCIWRVMAVLAWGLPYHFISPAFASPLCYWFDWTLGAYVANRAFEGRRAFTRPVGWIALLSPLFIASTLYKPTTIFSFSLASAISAVVLDLAIRIRWEMKSPLIALRGIGIMSYSLYLWHQPLLPIVRSFLIAWMGRPWIGIVSFLLVTGLSWLSYQAIERSGIFLGRVFWSRLKVIKQARSCRMETIMA